MNDKQKSEVMAVIDVDCAIRFNLIKLSTEKVPRTCAIGALALAAGVNELTLLEADANGCPSITSEDNKFMGVIRGAIEQKFGLTTGEMRAIQQLNDSCPTPEARREAIRAYVMGGLT